MDFFAVVDRVIELLRSRGRVSYQALRIQFNLDDEALKALKAELIEVHQMAVDQVGTMLRWTGDEGYSDLVDSTPLASQLDPEDYREVVRAYQATGTEVIQRLDGHIAQYLRDGLLVYFGYPRAHQDVAQRAVRTALGILEAVRTLNSRLTQE
jgi:class 3 adenylate cyclase